MDRNPRPPASPASHSFMASNNATPRIVQIDQSTFQLLMQQYATEQRTGRAVSTSEDNAAEHVITSLPSAVHLPVLPVRQHPLPKLPIFRPPAPALQATMMVPENASVLLRSFPEPNLCVLNMQAEPPSPDTMSTLDEEDLMDKDGDEEAVSVQEIQFPLSPAMENVGGSAGEPEPAVNSFLAISDPRIEENRGKFI